jgi:hypothetical protein
MSKPGLSRPDVCSIRAAARHAAFAEAAPGLLGAGGCPPADDDLPLPGRDSRLRPVLPAALASIPHRFKDPIRQLGTIDASLVADVRRQRTGAGR